MSGRVVAEDGIQSEDPPFDPGTTSFVHTAVLMDTMVRIEIPRGTPETCGDAVERAFTWFREVEAASSRFDESSEVMQLARHPHSPVSVSPLLFESIRFALDVAEASEGAFDPTIGATLERRGFNRNYRTGQAIQTPISDGPVSFRDVLLDEATRTVTLAKPLILDLGAVVKGLAIDLAARELAPFRDFAIDAGGDLYLGGNNLAGAPWRVGIRHPRQPDAMLTVVQVSNLAVCTSGDYERAVANGHHIVDPRTGRSTDSVCSVTVIGPTAMSADALGTAAFVLGLANGTTFLRQAGVDGLLITPDLKHRATPGFRRYQV